ncbi:MULTISPECIES: hypothetical protein [unclassified Cohnella]|uniref:hypothetical protein n=1 Tax=unclassified Cohnella TaxID=2636738 RepID=UPI00361DF65A
MAISWIVVAIGVVVSLLGWLMTPSAWGYGILGFGLAWIALGLLDLFREPARGR